MSDERLAYISGKIVAICEAILREEIGVIPGARILQSLSFDLPQGADDDFSAFVTINSDTNHLKWSAEAVQRKDQEIAKAEQSAKELAFPACRKLIERFRMDVTSTESTRKTRPPLPSPLQTVSSGSGDTVVQERRSDPRVPLFLEVVWESASGKHAAHTSDLGLAGCFIDTVGQVLEGETIRFRIDLREAGWIEAKGIVTYSFPNIGYGVRFTELSAEDKGKIEKLIGST
jgi:hypothetical protein